MSVYLFLYTVVSLAPCSFCTLLVICLPVGSASVCLFGCLALCVYVPTCFFGCLFASAPGYLFDYLFFLHLLVSLLAQFCLFLHLVVWLRGYFRYCLLISVPLPVSNAICFCSRHFFFFFYRYLLQFMCQFLSVFFISSV